MKTLLDRIRRQIRLTLHGCDWCGRRFTTTEDGYLCDGCDDDWCETIADMYRVRLSEPLKLIDDNFQRPQ